ncbi:hypothetical protein DFH94DRAFT_846157 [Russula ochroleuca]|uniref:Uncharacterized protein n=1 Tax=Russula ochroleuca TaxID=152965 RepID=A0A9P5MST4_9AGAM|nr:hypothetical protein DFH94DRAFT_846157 [Russula ochroleuca]
MTLNNDMAALVGFGCEAFFYGCHTILFALATYLKLNSPDRISSVKGPLFILSVFLYLSCSTHFTIGFIHFYNALNSTGVKGFSNASNSLLGASILVVMSNFFGELILIYRCWVLWSKNYWIIFIPSFTVILWMVSACVDFHFFLQKTPTSIATSERLSRAMFIVSVCENAIVTTLIVVRIWHLSPRSRRDVLGANFPGGTGRAAVAIVIESGLLYLSVQLIYCILFNIGHPAQLILVGIALQTYGIAPTLIFIRMSGLLNTLPGLVRSGAAVTPLGFAGNDRTTVPTNPGMCIAVDIPMSEIKLKPSGRDLASDFGSKFGSMEKNSTRFARSTTSLVH